ncbi:hypothetical protein D3C84_445110 [compost metagenome]
MALQRTMIPRNAFFIVTNLLKFPVAIGTDVVFQIRDQRRFVEDGFFTGHAMPLDYCLGRDIFGHQSCLEVTLIVRADIKRPAQGRELFDRQRMPL